MRHGYAAAELGRVFDIVNKEGGGVEHRYYARDDTQGRGGDSEPGVEGGDELGADVFARVRFKIVEGAFEDVFLFCAPA